MTIDKQIFNYHALRVLTMKKSDCKDSHDYIENMEGFSIIPRYEGFYGIENTIHIKQLHITKNGQYMQLLKHGNRYKSDNGRYWLYMSDNVFFTKELTKIDFYAYLTTPRNKDVYTDWYGHQHVCVKESRFKEYYESMKNAQYIKKTYTRYINEELKNIENLRKKIERYEKYIKDAESKRVSAIVNAYKGALK